MRGLIISLGVWFLGFTAFSQTYTLDQQQQGTLFLNNGDTLTGFFTLDLGNDLVKLNANGIKTFTARQLGSFTFADQSNKRQRFFYALPYPTERGYLVPRFFELIYNGMHASLLVREFMSIETVPIYDPMMNRNFLSTQQRLTFDFFFRMADGKMIKFDNRKKSLLQLFDDKRAQIEQFAKQKDLSFNNGSDLIAITEYYNQLKNTSPPDKP